MKERPMWGGRFEFMLSCIGYAIGIGNIWRFPYLCMRNGGGAFLIPYFTSTLLCGMPLFFMELAIGQFASRSTTKVWNICPLFKGLGWAMVAVSGIVTIYYNCIITWVLYYLYRSLTTELPWATCDNKWNTPNCLISNNTKVQNLNPTGNVTVVSNTTVVYAHESFTSATATPEEGSAAAPMSPAEEFWERGVLELSSGIDDIGGIKWELFAFFVLGWVIVFACLFKGIRSSGKVVYVTAIAPYVFLIILFIRGVTLPGALDGIKYYIIPEFSRLLDFKVWTEANLQIFYSLGPAWGGIITMASYNKFNNNCYRDAMIVPLINCGTSFFGGFVIFSIIGFMAHESGLPVQDVVKSGPGLAFVAYPEAMTKLPISPMWSVFFFVMLLTLGLDTQFVTVETLISGFEDSFPKVAKHKVLFTGLVCFIELLIGVPLVTRGGMYIFQLMDWYVGAFSVMIISLFECIVIMWIYGHERFFYDIECMIGYRPNIWWKICLCGITPVIIVFITIYNIVAMGKPFYGSYTYPAWSVGLGWCIGVSSLIPIPVCFVYELYKQNGSLRERLRKGMSPSDNWDQRD